MTCAQFKEFMHIFWRHFSLFYIFKSIQNINKEFHYTGVLVRLRAISNISNCLCTLSRPNGASRKSTIGRNHCRCSNCLWRQPTRGWTTTSLPLRALQNINMFKLYNNARTVLEDYMDLVLFNCKQLCYVW